MSDLVENITDLETKENTLINNKVANFCYEKYAYEHDIADGVTDYEFERANNIPVDTPSIIKLNDTVVNKGFRSQASSLPRMAMNHFLGRVSYNLNKTVDVVKGFLTLIKNAIGTANGLATLDSETKVPLTQLHAGGANGLATLNSNEKLEVTQTQDSSFAPVLGKMWTKISKNSEGRRLPFQENVTFERVKDKIFAMDKNCTTCVVTVDFGETWSYLQPSEIDTDYDSFASSIYKLKNKLYIALRNTNSFYTQVFSTENGVSWQKDILSVRYSTASEYIVTVLETEEASFVYINGSGLYRKESMGGWALVIENNSDQSSVVLKKRRFSLDSDIDITSRFVLTISSNFFISSDGVNWQATGNLPIKVTDIVDLPESSVYIAYNENLANVYATFNNGQSWFSQLPSSYSFNKVYSITPMLKPLRSVFVTTNKGSYIFSLSASSKVSWSPRGFNNSIDCEKAVFANGIICFSSRNTDVAASEITAIQGFIQNSSKLSGTPMNGVFEAIPAGKYVTQGTYEAKELRGHYKLYYASGIWIAMNIDYFRSDTGDFLYSLDGITWCPAMLEDNDDWNYLTTPASHLCTIKQMGDVILATRGKYVYRSSVKDLIRLGWL